MSEAWTGNREHEDLLKRSRKIWSEREETVLLQGDRFLLREQHYPAEYHTADYLRAWIRTRELAIQAYGRARGEEGQPTLHRWLVRKDSYRDGEGRDGGRGYGYYGGEASHMKDRTQH